VEDGVRMYHFLSIFEITGKIAIPEGIVGFLVVVD
jgi:hypothetical protein